MGRKHRNASQRGYSKLSVRGVKVQYNRMPSVVLDMTDCGIWEHAVALGAALWCRDRYSSSVGVNLDPYGVWQSCRFILTSSGMRLRPVFDDSIVDVVTSVVRQEVRRIGVSRGLSDETINRSVREVTPLPLMMASFWHTVSLIVGSMDRISQSILLRAGEFRTVWLVPHKIEHQVRSSLPTSFLVVEKGVPEPVISALNDLSVPFVRMDSSSPHEFVAAARGKGCIGVVAVTRDGLALGYSAVDRCYQVVDERTRGIDVLMAPHLRIELRGNQVHLPSALLQDFQVSASS